jgi:hypothetical protein
MRKSVVRMRGKCWLLENRDAINAKIRLGIEQLDRGEGIPEDQLDAHLAKIKAQMK